jgi:hypothetical protein
MAMHSLSTRAS